MSILIINIINFVIWVWFTVIKVNGNGSVLATWF